jgi:hypothetical protein
MSCDCRGVLKYLLVAILSEICLTYGHGCWCVDCYSRHGCYGSREIGLDSSEFVVNICCKVVSRFILVVQVVSATLGALPSYINTEP